MADSLVTAGESKFFCPMVKAFGYGHDDVAVSKTLVDEGVSCLGVALFEEGFRLREAGLSKIDILVFHPIISSECVEMAAEQNLIPVLSSWREISFIEKAKRKPLAVHIKFNTGMNRLGFEISEAEKLKAYFEANSAVKLTGVCTHFHSAEDLPKVGGHTRKQIALFGALAKAFSSESIVCHAHNSSALVSAFSTQTNAPFGARPGLAIYGVKPEVTHLTPAQKEIYNQIDLKPVMKVTSQIVHQHELKRGESVSYGARFVAEINSTVGVVPIGYADGYPRHLSSRGAMLYDGRPAPVSGTVCMDFTMINLTLLKAPDSGWVGQNIVILGDSISAGDLARLAGTNSYEILTNFSRRVPRVMV